MSLWILLSAIKSDMKYRIALLPTQHETKQLIEYSQSLPVSGPGFRLDQDHHPHITIVAFEAEEATALEYWSKLEGVVLVPATSPLEKLHFSPEEGYILYDVALSSSLQSLARHIRAVLEGDIGRDRFDKYAGRAPHLTLGVDDSPVEVVLPEPPLHEIHFDRLVLAESAELGSIRKILKQRGL